LISLHNHKNREDAHLRRRCSRKILILCPAPLTIQWQDELLRWFNEPFEIVFAAVDQQQLVNLWRRASQVMASTDYAKQDTVRERVWNEPGDLVIVDEAHKCSAYTKSAADPQRDESRSARGRDLQDGGLTFH
jgi:SNF2 family DNA or RNA helicase